MKQSMILVLMCGLVLFCAAGARADDVVQVTKVIDGDSVEVRFIDGRIEKVRLIGINAPELFEQDSEARKLAEAARSYVKGMLSGKTVELTYDDAMMDIYGRVLAYLWLGDVMFNEQIIADGYARAYLKYSFREDYMKAFGQAQEYAKKHRCGLWVNPAFETAGSEDIMHYTSPSKLSPRPPANIPHK